MASKKTTVDPVFAKYAKTSAHGDLVAFIGYASRRLAEYDLPARSVELLREMVALEPEISRRDNTSADKRRVHHLTECFKSSIPFFAGACGVTGSWVDPVPGWSWSYACGPRVERAIVVRLRYDGNPWEKCEAHRQAEANYAQAQRTADALHHYKVPMRIRPLDAEAVQAMIHATSAEPAAARVEVKRAARRLVAKPAAALTCPSCSSPLSTAASRFLCTNCGTSWELTRTKAANVRTTSTGKSSVDWRAAGLKAAETRRRNAAKRAAEEAA